MAAIALCSIFSTALPAQAQTTTYCDCKDIAQIQSRIDDDNAAINAYIRYEATVVHNPFNTVGAYAAMQSYVQAAMDKFATQPGTLKAALDPGEQALTTCVDGKGHTAWPTNYKVVPTPCLHRALELHEDVHVRECNEAFDKPVTGKRTLTLSNRIAEEIKAYTTEVDFLSGQKKQLLCNCDYYALKYSQKQTLDYTSGTYHQTDAWHLTSNSGDVMMVPLNLSEGSFSGHGDGTMSMTDADRGGSGQAVSSCNSTGAMTEAYDVSGRMAPTIILNVAETMQSIHSAGDCNDLLGHHATSQNLQPNAKSSLPPLQFTKIDTPYANPDRTTPYGGTVDIEARMVVQDKWIGVKAKNGAGDTVDNALKVIGFVNC